MGSLEEEKLFQMVYDFIESADESPIPTHTISPPLNHHYFTNYLILQEVVRSGSDGETAAGVSESVLKHMKHKMDTEKNSNLKKWLVMKLKIDGYNASLCQTSWLTTFGCPSGDYEYIDIISKDKKNNTMRHIIDIDFKSQFELARPTKGYKKLIDILPKIFIGDENKLKKIISVLSSAAKQSLNERGLHIPPWRTSTYMHSKWFSDCHKHKVTAGSFSRAEVDSSGVPIVSSKVGSSKWSPPMVNPKKKGFGGGSGLSSQFSNLSTKCC